MAKGKRGSSTHSIFIDFLCFLWERNEAFDPSQPALMLRGAPARAAARRRAAATGGEHVRAQRRETGKPRAAAGPPPGGGVPAGRRVRRPCDGPQCGPRRSGPAERFKNLPERGVLDTASRRGGAGREHAVPCGPREDSALYPCVFTASLSPFCKTLRPSTGEACGRFRTGSEAAGFGLERHSPTAEGRRVRTREGVRTEPPGRPGLGAAGGAGGAVLQGRREPRLLTSRSVVGQRQTCREGAGDVPTAREDAGGQPR